MSELPIQLLEELTNTSINNEDYRKTIFEQIFVDLFENPNPFVSYLNNQLSNVETREHGLVLLNEILKHYRNENLITEHGLNWFNYAVKYCQAHNQGQNQNVQVFYFINHFLQFSYNNPELNKSLSTSGVLNKLIEYIEKQSASSVTTLHNHLKCLELCLRLYPSVCIPYKNGIERYLINTYVDCGSIEYVRIAGKCLLTLLQMGGGGTHGLNHKQTWRIQQENLCATIHLLMDQLFESQTEFCTDSNTCLDGTKPLQLPDMSPTSNIAIRTRNIIIFLQEMLIGKYPVPKPVIPKRIINIISRGLAVTRSTISKQQFSILAYQLDFIHKHLLQLLQTLIVCLGRNLIPFATIICQIIMNSLKRTSLESNCSSCELRIIGYQTLRTWLMIGKSTSRIQFTIDAVLPIIIGDLKPIQNQLHLTIQPSSKQMSKKARKKLQVEQIIGRNDNSTNRSNISNKFHFGQNFQIKICKEALVTLQCIFQNIGYVLKPVVHQQLQEFLLKIFLYVNQGSNLEPYKNIECKAELIKTLTSLVTYHHWNVTPPYEYVLHLLTNCQNSDNDIQLSSEYSVLLSILNRYIHPACSTLHFTENLMQVSQDQNVEDNNEENRNVNTAEDVNCEELQQQQQEEVIIAGNNDNEINKSANGEDKEKNAMITEEEKEQIQSPVVIVDDDDDDDDDLCMAFVDILNE